MRLQNHPRIRRKNYKYLGILETDNIKQAEMKEKIKSLKPGSATEMPSKNNHLGSSNCKILMLYCHLLIHAEIHIYILDTYRHNDNRRMINDRCTNKGRKKTSLQIYSSHFIWRVRKGCSRFACERVLGTEHKLHILTTLLWPSRCVYPVL